MKGATSGAERLAGFVDLFDDPSFPSIKRVSDIQVCDGFHAKVAECSTY